MEHFKAQWLIYLPYYVLPTVYLCVLCRSENKQRLFPYTALTDWFVQQVHFVPKHWAFWLKS